MEILNVSTENVDGVTVIECNGTLKKIHEDLLNNLLENSFVQGAKGILFDWSNVTYFDSMGLECLIGIHKKNQKYYLGPIAVLITNPVLSKTYKVLRFDMLIPLFNNKKKALASLQKSISQLKPSRKLSAS